MADEPQTADESPSDAPTEVTGVAKTLAVRPYEVIVWPTGADGGDPLTVLVDATTPGEAIDAARRVAAESGLGDEQSLTVSIRRRCLPSAGE